MSAARSASDGAVAENWGRAFGAYAVMSVVFLTAIFGFATMRIAGLPQRPSHDGGTATQLHPEGVDLISFRFMRQGFVYYGGKPVPEGPTTPGT